MIGSIHRAAAAFLRQGQPQAGSVQVPSFLRDALNLSPRAGAAPAATTPTAPAAAVPDAPAPATPAAPAPGAQTPAIPATPAPAAPAPAGPSAPPVPAPPPPPVAPPPPPVAPPPPPVAPPPAPVSTPSGVTPQPTPASGQTPPVAGVDIPVPGVTLPSNTPGTGTPGLNLPGISIPGLTVPPSTTVPTTTVPPTCKPGTRTPKPSTTLPCPTFPRPNTTLPCPAFPQPGTTLPAPAPMIPFQPVTTLPPVPAPQPSIPAPTPQPNVPMPAPQPSTPAPAPQPEATYAVFGDPVIKQLGAYTETLNNTGGRYVVMESKDGSYLVEHEIVEEEGSAAGRRDHRNGAYTQSVAIQQDGNKIVYRNQQNATTLGKTVNQLVVNGKVVNIPVVGRLALPNGGEVTYSPPDKVSPEGVITVTSAQGDKLVIKDRGNHIDLYGTPSPKRAPGTLAGIAGANDPGGPGFYSRQGQREGQAGWEQLHKLPGGQLRGTQADADFVRSWLANGKEDLLGS